MSSMKSPWLARLSVVCLLVVLFVSRSFILSFSSIDHTLRIDIQQQLQTNFSSENVEEQRSLESVYPLTGKVLSSYDDWNRDERFGYASDTDTILYGRLYMLVSPEAGDSLAMLAQQGVDVRVLGENRPYKDYGRSRDRLLSMRSGSMVRYRSDEHLDTNFNHTKTFVNDRYLIVQSANLTASAWGKNIEHALVLDDRVIVDKVKQLFLWDREGILYTASDIHPNILLCPLVCRSRLHSMLEQADKSIWMYHQYIIDDDVVALIDDALERGIDVRLRLSDNEHNYALLYRWGEDVVRIQEDPYVHTKLMIIDHAYAMVGSMNLSTNSIDKNREISVIVKNPDAIQQLSSHIMWW